MGSKLFFSLDTVRNKKNYSGGTVTNVTSNEMAGLVNISFSLLKLNKNGFQEPIWHPNAHKIGYCIQGDAEISIRSPGSADQFSIKEGDIFFIPKGYVYAITNIGDNEVIIPFALDHTKPDEMDLTKAVYSLSDSVFTATFGTKSDFFQGMIKNNKQELIKTLSNNHHSTSSKPNPYKFDIESSKKIIQTKGGYVQSALKGNLPMLDGLSILGFGLNPHGIVEPHWHTNAGELIYIIKGHTRITVLGPDGPPEVLEVKGGQGAFAPASHFHNIENVGNDDVEVIAFFSDANPDFIGIGEVLGSYSNEMLGSMFNVSANFFDSFKKPTEPLVIVPV